jgi:hypothetical protein
MIPEVFIIDHGLPDLISDEWVKKMFFGIRISMDGGDLPPAMVYQAASRATSVLWRGDLRKLAATADASILIT